MKRIRVLITGVGGGGVGMQILKSLHHAKTPYYIIGAETNEFSVGLYEVDVPYILPYASDATYIEKLLKVCKKEKVQVLIPGSEPELKKISDNREVFEKEGILVLINSKPIIDICMDKWKTQQFFKEHKLQFPESFLIKKRADLKTIKQFPVVVKPADGHGSANTYICQDEKELNVIFAALQMQGIYMVVQKYMGSGTEEYTVGVLHDRNGTFINSIVIKRLVQGSLSGKTKIKDKKNAGNHLVISSGISQGIVGAYPDVAAYARKVAEKLGSTGPINVQCRKDKKGIFAFEVNPRFSGTTFIRTLMGNNHPDILIRHYILGEKIKPVKNIHGVVLRDLRDIVLPKKKINKA